MSREEMEHALLKNVQPGQPHLIYFSLHAPLIELVQERAMDQVNCSHLLHFPGIGRTVRVDADLRQGFIQYSELPVH